jgi:AraC-like DNA-binding protein
MQFQKILPPKFLSNYVKFFWTIELKHQTSKEVFFRGFASRYPRLIFQHHNGSSAISFDGEDLPLTYIGGLTSEPYSLGINPSISMTGVILYPHALKILFKTDSNELLNQLPDFEYFLPKDFNERMLDAKTPEKRIALLIELFKNKILGLKCRDESFSKAFSIIETFPNQEKVGSLTEFFGLSERQLERKFKANFGHTPVQFLRIKRFENSLAYIQSKQGRTDWKLSDVAYDLNYTDQSHFIRDFKQFSNHTPMQFMGIDNSTEENSAMYYSQNR